MKISPNAVNCPNKRVKREPEAKIPIPIPERDQTNATLVTMGSIHQILGGGHFTRPCFRDRAVLSNVAD